MIVKTLYKYQSDKYTVVSLNRPDTDDFEILFRLIAEDGKALTQDNKIFTYVVDTDTIDGWYETDYVDPEEGSADDY